MARSADRRRRACTAAVALTAAAALSGCVSTQTKNARTLIVNQRTLDSEDAIRVKAANPDVTVTSAGLIHAAAATAVVVQLHNTATHALSDLPISVGFTGPGSQRHALNGAANLDYNSTHVASIPAGGSTFWVLDTGRSTPRSATAYAEVGVPSLPPSTHERSIPVIRVTAPATALTGGTLRIKVTNSSGIPQYGLPVYAIGTRDGQVVEAGSAVVATLNGGAQASAVVHLIGATAGAQLQLSAPATIFN